MPKLFSLKSKLWIAHSLIHLLMLILLGAGLYLLVKENFRNETEAFLKVVVLEIKEDYHKLHSDYSRLSLDEEEEFDFPPLYIQILKINKKGLEKEILKQSGEITPSYLPPLERFETFFQGGVVFGEDEKFFHAFLLLEEKEDFLIVVQVSTTKQQGGTLLESLYYGLALLLPATLFLLILASGWLIDRSFSPLHSLLEEISTLDPKRPSWRLRPQQHNSLEVEELTNAFNALLERLQEAFNRLSEFSSDVSHEIKTPLSSLRIELEMAAHSKNPSPQQEAFWERNLKRIDLIQKIIENLLLLSQTDRSDFVMESQDIYLDEIIFESLLLLKNRLQEKSISLKTEQITPITLHGNLFLLQIAIKNLIENAIIHSPFNASIRISLQNLPQQICLEIEDEGKGIPTKEYPKVFKRFYRVQSHSNEGSGLGLAIVKRILDLHQATIFLQEGHKGGLKVICYFSHAPLIQK